MNRKASTLGAILAMVLLVSGSAGPGAAAGTAPVPVCVVEGQDDKCEETAADVAAQLEQREVVATSPDGSIVFVAGRHSEANYEIGAYDARTGESRWVGRHGTSGGLPTDIEPLPDGRHVVVTSISARQRPREANVVAFSVATGAVVWKSRLGTGGTGDKPRQVLARGDGRILFVAGETPEPTGFDSDVFLTSYRAATGDRLARLVYDGPRGLHDLLPRIAFSHSERTLFVKALVDIDIDDSGIRTVLLAVNPDPRRPSLRWEAVLRRTAPAGPITDVGETVAVTGYGGREGGRLATVAFDVSSGERLWKTFYPVAGTPRTFVVDEERRAVLVAGHSEDGESSFAAAYRWRSGRELWTVEDETILDDMVLAPARNDRIYLSGTAEPPCELVTIALDKPSRSRRWIARYESPASDLGCNREITLDAAAEQISVLAAPEEPRDGYVSAITYRDP
ncbi:MAG: PQQ-like beta-propeller repeat protein [Actinomycetota bacterium]|nr:PQQ-like beta-propeller repeat protein [Actinomycetota bacterium]